MSVKVQCPFCLKKIWVEIFREDGESQSLIYDCEVCCHPIEIEANWDSDLDNFQVFSQKSSGFD